MADFSLAIKKVLTDEGGMIWTNRTGDRGGETFAGISRKFHAKTAANLWKAVDAAKGYSNFPEVLGRDAMQRSLRPLVEEFYCNAFWVPLGLDRIGEQSIAQEILDIAVNCGKRVAAAIVQQEVNRVNFETNIPDIKVDSMLGPASIAAINALARHSMVARQALVVGMNISQGLVYQRIVDNDPGQGVNYRGWITKRVMF